jgi:glycerol-3-phosphate acyltransferase PlsY
VLEAGLIVAAYLLGSIPTGVLLARARGVDIRKVGSGNIGATNVARSLGRRLGAVTLVFDCAKGGVPVLAADALDLAPELVAAVGMAAFLGHVFSVFLRFGGGKGVATAFGVFLAVAPAAAGIAAGIYVLGYALTRISSVGSLLGAAALVPLVAAFGAERAYLVLSAVILVAILFTHRGNIRRLFSRQESKV